MDFCYNQSGTGETYRKRMTMWMDTLCGTPLDTLRLSSDHNPDIDIRIIKPDDIYDEYADEDRITIWLDENNVITNVGYM